MLRAMAGANGQYDLSWLAAVADEIENLRRSVLESNKSEVGSETT